ncbi:hypothetical protein HK405_010909, partial [Cladochytrium tenue]
MALPVMLPAVAAAAAAHSRCPTKLLAAATTVSATFATVRARARARAFPAMALHTTPVASSATALALPDFAIFAAAARRQDHAAVVDAAADAAHATEPFSYRSLLHRVARTRSTVLSHVQKGERVAFLYPRSHAYVTAQWAAWASQAVAVPLCTSHPPHELAHVVADCRPSTILFHPRFADAIAATRTDPRVVEAVPGAVWTCTEDPGADGSDDAAAVDVSFQPFDKSQGALIIYTSGTTGKPKGVLSTFANIEAQVDSLHVAWRWTQDDKILLLLPLHHIHILTCALAAGATVEMAPEKFNPAWTWRRILDARRDLTLFMAVPTVYAKLAQEHAAWPADTDRRTALEACGQFRLMVSGSAALPAPMFDKWRELSGHTLLERYGMTEIGMAIGNRYGGPREKGKVGEPFPGVEIKLVDEDGRDVTGSLGAAGEILVRGPQ